MTGIYAVATLPEHRGTGLASELVTQLIRRGWEEGAVISALYPAALRPYRSIGYELAGTFSSMFTGFLSPADAVRTGVLEADPGTVEFLSPPWMPEWF